MKLWIVRHGKTKSNEEKRYTGKTDVSLSPSGIEEIKNLSAKGIYPNNYTIYTSSLVRTLETAKLIYGENCIITDRLPSLNETDFGDFEGQTYENLKYDPNYQKWITDFSGVTPNNGESFEVFKQRVITGFTKLTSTVHTNSILFTHGGVIRIIMSELVDNNIPFFNWNIPNGLGYILDIEDGIITSYEVIT